MMRGVEIVLVFLGLWNTLMAGGLMWIFWGSRHDRVGSAMLVLLGCLGILYGSATILEGVLNWSPIWLPYLPWRSLWARTLIAIGLTYLMASTLRRNHR